MNKPINTQLESYEQREHARRQQFIERMEQKWLTKIGSLRDQGHATAN